MQYTWIISKTDLPKSMEKLSSTKWSLVPKMLETAALRDGIDIYFFKKLFFSFSSLSFLLVWTEKKKVSWVQNGFLSFFPASFMFLLYSFISDQ